jgi:hypothetical protein
MFSLLRQDQVMLMQARRGGRYIIRTVPSHRWLRGLNISGCFKVKDVSPLLNMPLLNTVILHDRMSGM